MFCVEGKMILVYVISCFYSINNSSGIKSGSTFYMTLQLTGNTTTNDIIQAKLLPKFRLLYILHLLYMTMKHVDNTCNRTVVMLYNMVMQAL